MSSVSQFPPPHLIAEVGDSANTASESDSQTRDVLALPAPIDASSTLQVDGEDVRFDHLGPLVVSARWDEERRFKSCGYCRRRK